jgi:cytochrome b subunit of formate dehydrogenase
MKSIALTAVTLCLLLVSVAQAQEANESCVFCHEDPDLEGTNPGGDLISMFVNFQDYADSIHGGMDCTTCHADLDGVDDFPHAEALATVSCSDCHDDVAETYSESAHGMATEKRHAATCTSCHGTHNILASDNPDSLTSQTKLPYTCAACHNKNALQEDPDIKVADPFGRYLKGIHAQGLETGLGSTANCADCHGMHDLKRASDPESRVNHQNLPETCSKCHGDIYIKYSRGIPGKALAAGISDSPNCSDCHGEHEILRISDPTSPVNSANLSDFVCGKCHNDQELIEKYGLSAERFSSYQDSYHGLAVEGGSIKAANCVSCHEAHAILPRSNPASSIHENNLVSTCRKCHPKANATFASSYSHNLAEHEFGSLNDMVRLAYIGLIVLVIGGMLFHNAIIYLYFVVKKYRRDKLKPRVSRFNGNMVFQHILLIVSFVVLVITGFALRYPDAWWTSVLSVVFRIDEPTRSVIHRMAAVSMIYVSIHHLFFMLLSKRGRAELKAILPVRADLVQPIQNLKFHLRLTKDKPQFAKYDYTEKAEYWALAWGTMLMAATGFVLWFPTFFTSFLPPWIIIISETVHLYEAWLAMLAIIVFHLFFVVFHPERFPMSLTWVDGKMPEDEVAEHHPVWADSIDETPSDADLT